MPQHIPWNRSLSAKLGGVVLALVALSVMLVAGNLYMLAELRGDAAAMNYLGRGRARAMEALYLAERLADSGAGQRDTIVAALREVITYGDQRSRVLHEGNPTLGIQPTTDPAVLNALAARDEQWRNQVKPLLERLIAAAPDRDGRADIVSLRSIMETYAVLLEQGVSAFQKSREDTSARFVSIQYIFSAIALLVLLSVLAVTRGIVRRTRGLAGTAEGIAGGNLDLQAAVAGRDEISALGESFNVMTANLRSLIAKETEGRAKLEELLRTIAETASSVSSATSEILAGTTQQASGAEEQAAAVNETVSTVDEVLQTSEQAAERAQAVADTSKRMTEIAKVGRKAVEDSVAAMGAVKEQTEVIAEGVLDLAEQAQAIGEIIATVNDIAEQTNLLALNAGIEASRAGEQGTGFGVVAREIKELADESKTATARVRQILSDIQKRTNSAVISTEEGTKGVNATIRTAGEAGEAIRVLAEAVDEAAQIGAQIAAAARQQGTGMAQIHQAMRDVSQTTQQNLASTRQAEMAARDLNALGLRLKGLVEGFER